MLCFFFLKAITSPFTRKWYCVAYINLFRSCLYMSNIECSVFSCEAFTSYIVLLLNKTWESDNGVKTWLIREAVDKCPMTSLSPFQIEKGLQTFLNPFLPLPMSFYLYPGSSTTSMANSGQLVTSSAPDSMLNFIATLGVWVWANMSEQLCV